MAPRTRLAAALRLLLQACVLFTVTLAGLALGFACYLALFLALATWGLVSVKPPIGPEKRLLDDWIGGVAAACILAGVAAVHLLHRRARRRPDGGDPALARRH